MQQTEDLQTWVENKASGIQTPRAAASMLSSLSALFAQSGFASTDAGPPASPTESAASSASHTAEQCQAAQAALSEAEALFRDGDETRARTRVEESLATGCSLPGAEQLLAHLQRFGPGSKPLATVTKTLHAPDDRAVLGIAPGEAVSPKQLKRAYKRLCLELHPDRCRARGAEAAFKRLQAAYAALDPNAAPKRAAGRAAAANPEAAARRKAEEKQRERDRGWTTRGVDPRYGQMASRGRDRPVAPTKRANGRAHVRAPKAGPPPARQRAAPSPPASTF